MSGRWSVRKLTFPSLGLGLALVVGLGAFPSAVARADDDISKSLYTENGFELRRDDRIYTLFAAFNLAGYDAAEVARTLPFPRYAYHPLRQKLRQELARGGAGRALPAVQDFLDAHPLPIERYEEAALTLGPAPTFAESASTPQDLAGLGKMLAAFASASHLTRVTAVVEGDYRAMFKRVRDGLDTPFGNLRKVYRLDEDTAPNLVFVPNPLGDPGQALGWRTSDGTQVVIFGVPVDDAHVDLKPALQAYSTLLADEATHAVTVDGLSRAVARLHERNVLSPEVTEDTLLRDSLRAAVAAKLWASDPRSAADDAFHRGLIFAPEFLKAFDEPADAFPAAKGPFVSQVASRVDIEQALARLGGG